MRTHNIPSCRRKSNRYPYQTSWPGTIINPHWLELPLSRTNFHGPKGVRANEDRLYLAILAWHATFISIKALSKPHNDAIIQNTDNFFAATSCFHYTIHWTCNDKQTKSHLNEVQSSSKSTELSERRNVKAVPWKFPHYKNSVVLYMILSS